MLSIYQEFSEEAAFPASGVSFAQDDTLLCLFSPQPPGNFSPACPQPPSANFGFAHLTPGFLTHLWTPVAHLSIWNRVMLDKLLLNVAEWISYWYWFVSGLVLLATLFICPVSLSEQAKLWFRNVRECLPCLILSYKPFTAPWEDGQRPLFTLWFM